MKLIFLDIDHNLLMNIDNRYPNLLLASSSPFRKMLLDKLHLAYETAAPEIDESAHKDESAENLVQRLAIAKAEKLAGNIGNKLGYGDDKVKSTFDMVRRDYKQIVKAELNELLKAPVDVNEISFSLLRKFPNASLSFNEVLAWDAYPGIESKDTLLYANKIFLEFNLIDLAFKKYKVKAIEIAGADIRLKWNSKGEANYIIWKKQKQEEGDPFKMDLENVTFKDCKLSIDHRKNTFFTNYYINSLDLEGVLVGKVLDLDCFGDLEQFYYQSSDK